MLKGQPASTLAAPSRPMLSTVKSEYYSVGFNVVLAFVITSHCNVNSRLKALLRILVSSIFLVSSIHIENSLVALVVAG